MNIGTSIVCLYMFCQHFLTSLSLVLCSFVLLCSCFLSCLFRSMFVPLFIVMYMLNSVSPSNYEQLFHEMSLMKCVGANPATCTEFFGIETSNYRKTFFMMKLNFSVSGAIPYHMY